MRVEILILVAVKAYSFLKKQPKGYAKKSVIKMNILDQPNQINAYLVAKLMMPTQQFIILDIIMNV